MKIGIENIIFNYWMVLILILYVLAMLPVIRRSFKDNHKYKWNNLTALIVLSAITIFLCFPIRGNFIVPYPWNFFFIVWSGAWILVVLIISFFPYKTKGDETKKDRSSKLYEYRRKTIHLMSLLLLFGFLFSVFI